MRRRYAFEAEGISEEVKSQLEKVEDVVEDKCTTEEACDKMLEKIGDEKEKFDNALQTMADAAKDCKDGKCDKAEMAEKITPKMAELKEVAKSIGVASEGEALTEAELKDARDYLNGVEEIVEAKKDEVCDGSCEKSEGEVTEDDDDDDDDSEEAEEAFMAFESYLDELDMAVESTVFDAAMEGANIDAAKALKDALGKIRTANKQMKAAKRVKDFKLAAQKANEAAGYADELATACNNIPGSVSSAVIANIAIALTVIAAGSVLGGVKGKKLIDVQKAARGGAVGKAGSDAAKAAAQQFNTAAAAGYDMMGKTAKDEARDAAKAAMAAKTKELKGVARKTLGRNIGAGAAKGAAAAGVASAAGAVSSISKFITTKRLTNADGELISENVHKMTANDVNALISAIKMSAKGLAGHFRKLAAKFSSKNPEDAASESFADTFDGFISACESYQFGTSEKSEKAPYLFG